LIAEKQWSGAQGLQLTPRIQLTIALQACLPILHLGLAWYAGWVGIVVYPGDFLIPRKMVDADGVVHEYDDDVLGEAWYGGPVLVSWFDHPQDARGINVVIHEFAHQLDQESGVANGSPPLASREAHARWAEVWSTEWQELQRRLAAGEQNLFGAYGATEPAEFFAVASEVFFERPVELAALHPPLYRELAGYYRIDPKAWH